MSKNLLYVPFEGCYLWLESPLAPGDLVEQAWSGEWQPPILPPGILSPCGSPLKATRLGEIVVVMPEALARRDGTLPAGTLPAGRGIEARLPRLSARQAQVLSALAEGLTQEKIAARHRISKRQVRREICRIKALLGVDSTPRALFTAALGLLQP